MNEKASPQSRMNTHFLHLSEIILLLLLKFNKLFDEILGNWDTKPVKFQLKPRASPYFGVPDVHLNSKWAAHMFHLPKNSGITSFISNNWEPKKSMVCKTFPIQKIIDVLLKLQEFQWVTAQDLNMGCYTIRLKPGASKMCTIILPWGKYCCKKLQIGIAVWSDIFQ